MPIGYSIDESSRTVRVVADGTVTLDDDKKCLEDMLADSRYQPGFAFLVDHRRRWPPATAEHVREMAWEFARRRDDLGPIALAILVDHDVTFGLARMFAALSDEIGFHTEVFREEADAEAWIALRLEAPP